MAQCPLSVSRAQGGAVQAAGGRDSWCPCDVRAALVPLLPSPRPRAARSYDMAAAFMQLQRSSSDMNAAAMQ